MKIRACLLIFAMGRSVHGDVSIGDSLRWCSWVGGIVAGLGNLGCSCGLFGEGGGGAGGPGWRGHYNAVNTFKF